MTGDFSALAYLEYRQIVNRVRQTIRQPGRALLYVLAVGYFIFVGVLRGRGARMLGMPAVPEPYAGALFFAYVTLLGIMMYGAASGIVGAFSCAADARFLSGSLISERLVILWLQIRRSGTAIGRMLLTVVLYALVFSRSVTFAGIGLAMLGGTLVATASAIPMLKLRNVIGSRTAQSLAGAVAAAGILPMAILLAAIPHESMARQSAVSVEHLGAGYAFNALFDDNAAALAALYGFGVLAIALSFVSGTGLYPDLYASSMRVLAFRQRQRSGGAAFTMEHRYEQRAARAYGFFNLFRGAWTVVWKEWIGFMRSPSLQRVFVFGLLACAGAGFFFGHMGSVSGDKFGESLVFASTVGNLVLIFVAMGSAIGLSGDISKPLWWIGRDSLWMRLVACTAGASWRMAACVAAAVIAWAAAMHLPLVALGALPLALVLVLHLRAVGLVLYSLFPSTLDQRGPLAFVRVVLTYLLAMPPIVVAAPLIIIVPGRPAVAIAGGMLCSALETLGLIAFAARRIGGQGVAFARAESM